MSARIEPLLVGFQALFTATQRYPERAFRSFPDGFDHPGQHIDEHTVRSFPGLDDHGAEVPAQSKKGPVDNLILRQGVPDNLFIAFPDPAVIAVFSADVGKLDQSPEVHHIAAMFFFNLVCLAEKGVLLFFFLRR